MKKLSALLLALVLAATLCFGAAAETVNYAGAWELTSISSGGAVMDPAVVGMTMFIILNEDGTATLSTMGMIEEGSWAPSEDGVALTDASGATENLIYRDGTLVIASDSVEMIMTPGDAEALLASMETEYAQILTNQTMENFMGTWVLEHIETTYDYYTLESLGVTMTIVIGDGSATVEITNADGTTTYNTVCTIEEIEELGTVMWASIIDPETGEKDGSGLMLLLYDDGQLVWYEYDSTNQIEYFYCCDKVTE